MHQNHHKTRHHAQIIKKNNPLILHSCKTFYKGSKINAKLKPARTTKIGVQKCTPITNSQHPVLKIVANDNPTPLGGIVGLQYTLTKHVSIKITKKLLQKAMCIK